MGSLDMTGIKKILYIQPSVGDKLNPPDDNFNRMVRESLEKYLSPGFEIAVRGIQYGGELPSCGYYASVAIPYIVEEILQGEKDGFAGVIVGCFGNLAVNEAREVVRIPVVGPGAAACHIGCLLGDKISIITTGARIQHKDLKLNEKYHHEFYADIRREIIAQGLLGRVASIRATNRSSSGGTAAFVKDGLASEVKALLEQGRKAIEEDGADVLILGCALMMGVSDQLQKDLAVPVVDPTLAALKVTEMLISMNLQHSVLAYPFKNVEADQCPIIYPPTLKGYHGYQS
jgi:allantoin racemase